MHWDNSDDELIKHLASLVLFAQTFNDALNLEEGRAEQSPPGAWESAHFIVLRLLL